MSIPAPPAAASAAILQSDPFATGLLSELVLSPTTIYDLVHRRTGWPTPGNDKLAGFDHPPTIDPTGFMGQPCIRFTAASPEIQLGSKVVDKPAIRSVLVAVRVDGCPAWGNDYPTPIIGNSAMGSSTNTGFNNLCEAIELVGNGTTASMRFSVASTATNPPSPITILLANWYYLGITVNETTQQVIFWVADANGNILVNGVSSQPLALSFFSMGVMVLNPKGGGGQTVGDITPFSVGAARIFAGAITAPLLTAFAADPYSVQRGAPSGTVAAGRISVWNRTQSSVRLIASPPSGTDSATLQWYKSDNVAVLGSAVAGATELSFTDTNATGVAYYTLTATVGGNTVTYDPCFGSPTSLPDINMLVLGDSITANQEWVGGIEAGHFGNGSYAKCINRALGSTGITSGVPDLSWQPPTAASPGTILGPAVAQAQQEGLNLCLIALGANDAAADFGNGMPAIFDYLLAHGIDTILVSIPTVRSDDPDFSNYDPVSAWRDNISMEAAARAVAGQSKYAGKVIVLDPVLRNLTGNFPGIEEDGLHPIFRFNYGLIAGVIMYYEVIKALGMIPSGGDSVDPGESNVVDQIIYKINGVTKTGTRVIPTTGTSPSLDEIATATAAAVWASSGRTLTGFGFKVTLSSTGLDNIPTTPPTSGLGWNFRQSLVMGSRRFYKPARYDKTAGTVTHFADDGTTVICTSPFVDDEEATVQGLTQ